MRGMLSVCLGQLFRATLNKSFLALFSGREPEVNSDSLPPNQSLA
jgi:hypothetical protein